MDPQNVSSPTAVSEESVPRSTSSDKLLRVIIFLLIGVTSVLLVMLVSMFVLLMVRTASTVIEDEDIVERLDDNSESSPEVDSNNPQNDTAENMAFENQKVFENSSIRMIYPGNWTIKEEYGEDGGSIIVNSPQIDNPDAGFTIEQGSFGVMYGLSIPIYPGQSFECTDGEIISSEVSKTVYMKVLSFGALGANEYIICESYDGGKTFSLPPTGDAFVISATSSVSIFMNDLHTILKSIVRK